MHTVTLTNARAEELFLALQHVAQQSWPVSAGLAFAHMLRSMAPQMQTVMEYRQTVEEEFLLRDDEGNPVPGPRPDTYRRTDPLGYNKRMREIAQEEVEVEIRPVPLALLVEHTRAVAKESGGPEQFIRADVLGALLAHGVLTESDEDPS